MRWNPRTRPRQAARRSDRSLAFGDAAPWLLPALMLICGRAGAEPNQPEGAAPDRDPQSQNGAPVDDGAPVDQPTQSSQTPPVPVPDTSGTPPLPPRDPGLPGISQTQDGERVIPDYEGRPPAPQSARNILIWIPRIVLFPIHVVTEYVLRRPLVAVGRWSEEHYLKERIYDAFTWNQGRSGVYPIFNLDVGLKATAGLTLFSHELLVPANSLKVSTYGSTQGVFGITAQDRLKVFHDGSGSLYIGGSYVERPDGVFYGLGSDTQTADKTYYSFVLPGVSLGLVGDLGGLNHATIELAYRHATFGPSHYSSSAPSIDERYGGPDQPPLPPGFDGYHLIQTRLGLTLDSRDSRIDIVPTGTGVRVQADGAYAIDPKNSDLQFVTWGAQAAGFYDLSGVRHVVALEVSAHFAENVGSRDIPFSELPSLGGVEWMRGFLGGRLRGPSTVAGTLQYRYPFWTFVDGELFSSLGNAFSRHLDDFGFGKLFLDMGFGLRTTFARDSSIALTLAFASNRLDAPDFHVFDTTRFSFGVIHGF